MTDLEDLADSIADLLTETPQTPSRLARRARITTGQAHAALGWMVSHQFAVAEGNGARTRYRARRFGER